MEAPFAYSFSAEDEELEARQNELYLAMRAVEEMPASEAQTACIVKLAERMRLLVELRGKSEVGRELDVTSLTVCPKPNTITWATSDRTRWARDEQGRLYYNAVGAWRLAQENR